MDRRSLLVVDDDRLILATLSEGLLEAGFEVLQADNGKVALELVQQRSVDLALLDMRMPGLSGLDVAKLLWEEHLIPSVFLSAYNEDELVGNAIGQQGVLGYLVKPMGVSQILPTLESALVQAREQKQLRTSVDNLSCAVTQTRDTSVAIGILMERLGIPRDQAFGMLRTQARSRRCKIALLATQLVDATATMNALQLQGQGNKAS